MSPVTFGSVCSGIEAASVAWNPLGWKAAWLSEIEPFPCAVLAHHYPDVPNLGDMTRIADLLRAGKIPAPDVFCGGTPCQAFSVAGLRRSLDDARGNLSLTFCEIANEIDNRRAADGAVPCVVFWENVPGVLSTKDNAFGCFLAGLAGEDDPLVPAGGKWTNAGCVLGPKRAVAWRVLDAQYFGVTQRRRRVFVVASARKGFDPAAVLFEFDGVRRDTPPRREAWQNAAGTLASRTDGGGFPGTDEACSGYVQPVGWPAEIAPTLNAAFGSKLGLENQHIRGGQDYSSQHLIAGGQLARCLTTKTRIDAETETLIPTIGGVFVEAPALSVALRGRDGGATAELGDEVAGCLRASTGGGTQAIAFSCKDHGADAAVGIAPTMRAMGHSGSHANAGGQLAIAYENNGFTWRDAMGMPHWPEQVQCVTGEVTHTLKAEGFDASEDGTGRGQPIVTAARDVAQCLTSNYGKQADNRDTALGPNVAIHGMAVRRLTPRECERLQGFPDDYTLIPVRGKPAADGPRYKALGNSWAVPNVRWIGARIDRALRALSGSI